MSIRDRGIMCVKDNFQFIPAARAQGVLDINKSKNNDVINEIEAKKESICFIINSSAVHNYDSDSSNVFLFDNLI